MVMGLGANGSIIHSGVHPNVIRALVELKQKVT